MKITRLMPAPFTVLGYRRDGAPIYQVAGGSGDIEIEADDTGAGGDGDDTGGESGETGKDPEAWSPPTKAEWLKVQGALSKANASAKQRREALAEKEAEVRRLSDAQAAKEAEDERKALLDEQRRAAAPVDAPTGRKGKKAAASVPPAPVPGLPPDVLTKAQVRQQLAEATRAAEERTAEKFKGMAVNQAARAALASSGVQSGNVSRLVRLLDLDEIQIDDDGEITEGLEEQIETLKAELPQLFKAPEAEKPKKRTPPPRVSGAGRPEAQERPRSSAEQMAAGILGAR